MSVTGILLAFERQINAKADAPAVLQGQTSTGGQEPVDTLLANLKSSGQGVPSQLVVHSSAKDPVEARYGREKTLFLNPWTAEVIGQPSESTRAFFGAVERVHRSVGMGMRSAAGRGITGAANLAFFFMLISGLYLWLPTMWSAASVKSRLLFRRGLAGRAREWNWHNVVGMWVAFPLVFIVASGVVMSYPWANNLLYTMTGSKPPVSGQPLVSGQPPVSGFRGEGSDRGNGQGRPAGRGGDAGAVVALHSVDEMVQVAKQQVPAWKSITVEVPRGNASILTLSVDTSVGGQPEKSLQLVINRETGQVQAVKRFSDNVAGRRLRAYARFVHTGEEFGLVGEAIAALASLGAVVLVWTGLSMALRRLLGMATGAGRIAKSVNADSELGVEAVNL
jgi:uncharacterized iron-regulated membrane protein